MKSSQNTSNANTITVSSSSSHRNTLAQIQSTPYGQSFSGSETDVSTSTENLSPEERYALEHTQRQEPQGQENVGSSVPGMASTQATLVSVLTTSGATTVSMARSNESNASISSSTNTLIIHSSQPDDSWNHRWMPGGYSTPVAGRKSVSSSINSIQDGVSASYNALNFSSSLLLDASLNPKASVPSYLSESGLTGSPKLSTHSSTTKYHAAPDLPDIPSSYLDQSEVLKHLLKREGKDGGVHDPSASSSNNALDMLEGIGTISSKNIKLPLLSDLDTTVNYVNYPPPPAYPAWRLDDSEKSDHYVDLAKSTLSKSQPDLSKLGSSKDISSPQEVLSQRIVSGQTDASDGNLQEVADILAQENYALKMEVDMYHRKVAKLQRFEMEIIKVHEAHEALVKLSERREQLERLARHKLQAEVKRLTDLNADLKDQVDVLSTQIASRSLTSDSADALRKELNKRDVFIAQLVSQNKELIAAKERQEIELTAQRQTLNEQRTHIDILDSALTNAQANVVKLEEELRKKQNLVEQAGQLKRLLVSLQLASDRREQSEKNLRHKLEKEIEQLRNGYKQEGPDVKLSDLRREIREKEEKIMLLEGEVTKWEQRYLQESALRQLAIEAASMPKDAKIAALEKTSQESERRIAQAKSDKIRHMDEIHNMNKKQAEYEARNRELETQIAEKNAMIRVLQKRAEEKETLYQNALMRNSLGAGKSLEARNCSSNTSLVQSHSAQASTAHSYSSSSGGGVGGGTGGAGSTAPSTPRRDEELGQENQAAGRPYFYKDQQLLAEGCSGVGASRSLATLPDLDSLSSDDLLVDNEDGMLGKLGVVCFPGLAHPGFAAGEGTVSKSLLACVEPRSTSLVPSSSSASNSIPRRPLSDLPSLGLGVGLDPPSLVHARPHSQPFESLPSYSVETLSPVSPPPPPPSHHPHAPAPSSQRDLSSSSFPHPHSRNPNEHSVPPMDLPRCNPPPYHGHHELLIQHTGASGVFQSSSVHPVDQGASFLGSPPVSPTANPVKENNMALPRPPMCRNPHHPTVACRKCNSVRSSNRQNAAILVRRANSSAGQINRNSAPLPGCQTLIDTDDAPSILERLRREWHLGNIPPKVKTNPPQDYDSESFQDASVKGENHKAEVSVTKGKANQCQQGETQQHIVPQASDTPSITSSSSSNISTRNTYVVNESNKQLRNSAVKKDNLHSVDEKILNLDFPSKNPDVEYQNNNNNIDDDKIELIILEDADHLKVSKNSDGEGKPKSVQNVI